MAARFAAQQGQNTRRLQEKATRYSALVAVDPGKPTLEVAAGLEGEHHPVEEPAPEAVGALEMLALT